MISIEGRPSSKKDMCNLNVCIKNRALGISNHITMKVKIPAKEWSADLQRPKKLDDKRPVKELDGMSYSELSEKIAKIKGELSVMEADRTLTVQAARTLVQRVMNEKYVREIEEKAIEEEKEKDEQYNKLTDWVSEYIRQCETGERLKAKSTMKVTSGTIRSYKGTLAQLKEYEKARHCILGFDDMTLNFYDDWKHYLIKKKYSPNTIGRHVKNLKTFLYAAEDMKLTTCQDFKSNRFSADHEDVDNVYIPVERLKEMTEIDLNDYQAMKERASKYADDEDDKKALIHALKRTVFRRNLSQARDIFVLGCLTGQRVSDYKRLTVDMVEQLVEGRDFLHIVQTKTGKDVYVPYTTMMKTILERYDGTLPKIHDQHLNVRIKIVGQLLGWVEQAGIKERRGMLEYRSSKKFYECIKTHTARRTFATNAYKSGVSLSSIMAVTGHSSEAMLRKYLKLDNKERAILAAEEFAKLKIAE